MNLPALIILELLICLASIALLATCASAEEEDMVAEIIIPATELH